MTDSKKGFKGGSLYDRFKKDLKDFHSFDKEITEGIKTASDADLKITITNPIFIYAEKNNFLTVCDDKHLNDYLAEGFKVITEEEAKNMPQYDTVSCLL